MFLVIFSLGNKFVLLRFIGFLYRGKEFGCGRIFQIIFVEIYKKIVDIFQVFGQLMVDIEREFGFFVWGIFCIFYYILLVVLIGILFQRNRIKIMDIQVVFQEKVSRKRQRWFFGINFRNFGYCQEEQFLRMCNGMVCLGCCGFGREQTLEWSIRRYGVKLCYCFGFGFSEGGSFGIRLRMRSLFFRFGFGGFFFVQFLIQSLIF